MNLNEKFIQHIDEKGQELARLLETKSAMTERTGEEFGSMAAKRAIDISDSIITTTPITRAKINEKGVKVENWTQIDDENFIGFGRENYQKFKVFIKGIHKHRDISQLVHESFLETEIFQWICQASDQTETSELLSTLLVRRIEESIESRTYCFPISNLIIHEPFKIGNITVKFFTSDALKNVHEAIKSQFEGTVVACADVLAERSLGEKIALEKCSLAVDLLKIYSKTLFNPETPIDFDIDVRTRVIDQATIISHSVGDNSSMNFTMYSVPLPTYLQPTEFEMMRELHIGNIIRIINSNDTENELSNMLVNAIRNFANALSVKNLHKRIADLFSVYESLLVTSKSAHILESLKKYGPKLITQEIEERKEIKKRFTDLYDVRSALIHHGQQMNFELFDLARLQFHLLVLILNLTNWNINYSTKLEVLTKIDEAIEGVQLSL